MQAISTAHAEGLADGLTQKVDALDQKYGGLETNINLHEDKLERKTKQYIAKLADLNQVAQYLERYTTTVNSQLVPLLRNLIQRMAKGITHHTEDVSKSVYAEMYRITGKTMSQVVKEAAINEVEKSRTDAKQAAVDARLYELSAKESVYQIDEFAEEVKEYLTVLLFELVLLVTITLVTPGIWTRILVTGFISAFVAIADYKLLKRMRD